jgi:hypothetical protein
MDISVFHLAHQNKSLQIEEKNERGKKMHHNLKCQFCPSYRPFLLLGILFLFIYFIFFSLVSFFL